MDPLIPAALAQDWISRLAKMLTTVRGQRRIEIQQLSDHFGDVRLLASRYVDPDCQPFNPADFDEDEPIRAHRSPIRQWISNFLKGEFRISDGRNTVFILSDAGMGKTSLLMMLKLTHLLKFWPQGVDFRLFKLGPESLGEIRALENRRGIVLLLDALDEDPDAWGQIEKRLKFLLQETENFRQVFITCRTQFFPRGGVLPIAHPGKIEVERFICNLLYLSPFSDEQVEEYLNKVFSKSRPRAGGSLNGDSALSRARNLVSPMKSLRMRPMLLAYIEDLIVSNIVEWNEYAIYHALVEYWLLREQRKLRRSAPTKSELWDGCEALALRLHTAGIRNIVLDEMAVYLSDSSLEHLSVIDVSGRSLLGRASDGSFRFSHYSIQEFFVAHSMVTRWKRRRLGEWLHGTEVILGFIFSWIAGSPKDRVGAVVWENLDLRNLDFTHIDNVILEKANLRNATLTGANLQGVSLRSADLSGAHLGTSTLRGADLEHCSLDHANLHDADLQSTNLQRAKLERCILLGARLQDADLQYANLVAASLRDARIQNANLDSADLREILLINANLEGAKLHKANLQGANCKGAGLKDADLRKVNLQGANLRSANLEGADLRDAILRSASLVGANLRNARIQGADLEGADLFDAVLPEGTS